MSTSNRALLIETCVASCLVLLVVGLASPTDLAIPALGVHPAWLPATLFAARYGARGLLVSLLMIATTLVGAAAIIGAPSATLLARAHNPSDVLALLTAVAATWIGMSQNNRVRRVTQRLDGASDGQQRAEATLTELSATADVLRARCDRMDTSLTLWRSLSTRLERGTPAEASQAALELCALRCGADAGVVERHRHDGSREIVARLGSWRLGAPQARDLSSDQTVRRAMAAGRTASAAQLTNGLDSDSDVALLVHDEFDGSVLGVIALRGVDPRVLCAAELRDLVIIAAWLSVPMARLSTRSHLRSVPEENQ